MYESFYGLVQSPFTLSPDPRFLYLSESHDVAIRRILQSIRRKEGFIVLSGDIGTGKTTLCRALLQQLDKTTCSSLILNPFMSVEELLREILVDFGVVSRAGLRSERLVNATKHDLTSTLSDFLATLAQIRGSAVLIIDEAQHLSPRVLEELRVISTLDNQEPRLLQIVLVGQPNLLDVLATADLRQLDQRISLRAMLAPLDKEDVEQYISHRLTVAGESVSVIFERAAVKRVHALSGGVPRVINLLCDRALMAGAERGVHEITPDLIERAADAVSFRRRPAVEPTRWQLPRWALVVTVLVALLALGLSAPLHRMVQTELPSLPPAPPRQILVVNPPPVPPNPFSTAFEPEPELVPRASSRPVEAPLP
jgi:general secretion pathway protein A